MANPDHYIEVITSASLSRKIESYRAGIRFTVSTRKKDVCLDEAASLRSAVINALAEAGIAPDEIEHGSGSFHQSNWSSSKSFSQILFVNHPDLNTLFKAMASVEKLLVNRSEGFWSPIKSSISFGDPEPQYRFDPDSVDESIATALRSAKTQAEELAAQAGLKITGVLSILQLSRAPISQPKERAISWTDPFSPYVLRARTSDLDDFSSMGSASGGDGPLPQKDTGQNVYRVRFGVIEKETSS